MSTYPSNSTKPASPEPVKNTGLIISVVILFILVLVLLLGVFSLNSKNKSCNDDIDDLDDTTIALSYNTTGITYVSGNTEIKQTLKIPDGDTVMIGTMDVFEEINSLNTDLSTGIASIDGLILTELVVNGASSLTGATTSTDITNSGNIRTNTFTCTGTGYSTGLNNTSGINNIGGINTDSLVTTNGVSGPIKQCCAGYMFDGTNGNYQIYPVLTTSYIFNPEDRDDGWYINPGYKIVLWQGQNWTNTSGTLDNTTGTEPAFFKAPIPNTTSSISVYFLGVEVLLPSGWSPT